MPKKIDVRNLPKTVEYLEALGGIYFKGHHKVGVNLTYSGA